MPGEGLLVARGLFALEPPGFPGPSFPFLTAPPPQTHTPLDVEGEQTIALVHLPQGPCGLRGLWRNPESGKDPLGSGSDAAEPSLLTRCAMT